MEKVSDRVHPVEESSNRVNLKYTKLNEEINLLYVAITRTKSRLYIPEDFVPLYLAPSKQIRILKKVDEEDLKSPGRARNQASWRVDEKGVPTRRLIANKKTDTYGDNKAFSVDEMRIRHRDAYKPWTQELDDELTELYCESTNVSDLASHFGRTKGAIRSRIKKLELKVISEYLISGEFKMIPICR